jgi:outer membrane protein insertion porin family
VYRLLTVPTFRQWFAAAALAGGLFEAQPALAQVEPCPAPVKQPPANSPVLLRCMEIVAHPVNETIVEGLTYQSHIRTPQTDSTLDKWAPYDERSIQSDFWNLWRTGFLDNLWIEVLDEPYDNGIMGKHVVVHIEERARVKMVDYLPAFGSKLRVDQQKIEETLRERNVAVKVDTFVDQSTIRRVKGVLAELYAEKGYSNTEITTALTELPTGPKLVHLTFTINEGPKVKIADVVFDGNSAFSDRKLGSQMKDNKPRGWLSFITGAGTYAEAKFPDDAEKINEFYRNEGYVKAVVGAHKVEVVRDSEDGKTRWVRLRIPVDEGVRYRVGAFNIADNTAVKTDALRKFFKIKEGDYFDLKKIRKGVQQAQKLYGSAGFFKWQPDPVICPRGFDCQTGDPIPGQDTPPIVDITVKMVEGKQFFVNRITFAGNTTTRDNVVRRELRVYEGGVFSTEGLTESIRRLNQLGYFKPLEGKADEIKISDTPGTDNRIDLKITFEEQNRNQLSFGAGVSQFDGFFGQLSFQTSNFLGRGETLGVTLQRGSQARQYQVSFSEPYLWDRPITVGTDVYTRQFVFPLLYSQRSTGANFVVGLRLADYTRLFTGYSFEKVHIYDVSPAYISPEALAASPTLRESLLVDQGGKRTVSKITPSVVFNTVNHPIFPNDGAKLTAGIDIAGLGGNTFYTQTRLEAIWYLPLTPRMSIGFHAEGQYVRPYGSTTTLPIFEKIFLGGEYNVRGFDIRSIGPRDPLTRLVTGGNKSLVFNGEYYINIAGPVRMLFFYDAGQVRDLGQKFTWSEPITEQVFPNPPLLSGPIGLNGILTPIGAETGPRIVVTGKTPAFKTSTGVEVRFFMPVLNVPFRLISAYNPSRRGVFNNSLLPQGRFTFRFAVGTTF